MSSKMNWDSVRRENLVQRHGSERACTEPEEVILKGPSPRPLMPGCTCGKWIGFKGPHKRRCKLFLETVGTESDRAQLVGRKSPAVTVPTTTATAPFSLRRFASAMNGIRQGQAIPNLLAGILKALANDMTSTDQQKTDALFAIRALLDESDEEKADPRAVAAACRRTSSE